MGATWEPTNSGPRPSIVPSASPSTAPTTVLRPSQNPSRETPIQYSTSSTVGSQGRFLPADVNQCLQTVDLVRTAVDDLAKKAGLEGTVQTTINSVDVTTNNNGVNQNETQTVTLSPPCQLATGTRGVGPTYLTTFNVVTKQYFGLSDAAAGSPKEQEISQHQINLFRAAVNLATMQAVIETAELVALVGTNFELGKLEQSADVLPGQVLSVSVSPTKSRSPSASPPTAPSGGPSQSPSDAPSSSPTSAPTKKLTKQPTNPPTNAPTDAPSSAPSGGNSKSGKGKSVKSVKSVKSGKSEKEGKGGKGSKKGRRGRGKLID